VQKDDHQKAMPLCGAFVDFPISFAMLRLCPTRRIVAKFTSLHARQREHPVSASAGRLRGGPAPNLLSLRVVFWMGRLKIEVRSVGCRIKQPSDLVSLVVRFSFHVRIAHPFRRHIKKHSQSRIVARLYLLWTVTYFHETYTTSLES
jgi:hypothetical protein